MKKTLFLDPSGNKGREGEGTTGMALFLDGSIVNFDDVKAENFESQELYWHKIATIILNIKPDKVVCESFRLFGHKAKQQIGSSMETSQLIGYLRMKCWESGIPFEMQAPSDKTRVADPQLVTLGILDKNGNKYTCMGRQTNLHQRDAIRHGVFYHRYGKGKVK